MEKVGNNFWQELEHPILAMAPLAGFTNSPFRQIVSSYGAAVVYSELASAAAIYYQPEVTLDLIKFNRQKEGKYVVQLFGSEPEHFAVAARQVTQLIKPDGLDINLGCPVGKVVKQGAGAALMTDFPRARAVIQAVLANTHLPVSIKIRTAVGQVDALDFLQTIQDLPLAALMIHGRTLKQGFIGPVDTDFIKKARQYFSGIILANGGVNSLADANKLLAESKADGLGLGRGALGRPWLFREIIKQQEEVFTWSQIAQVMLEQARLTNDLKNEAAFLELRKQLCYYVQGIPDASQYRARLVRINNYQDISEILSPVINDSL